MTRIDWPGLMRVGLRDLGLRPSEFWALTPRELDVMLGRDDAAAPLDRNRLGALQKAFPDETPKGEM
ncbi:rcc01693 family protein [Palleronia caenipelagi]|uniref:Phage tail assembly chaperone n=1 Tax=Palleronia caenipelagi TaxID=2489174 RepID=A0A547Q071_9RHOB|nr:rcc01693 family protein [Palleronia caenipelagi]TRD19765.1 phage tail assembly chaperone [Palleronia caenipelagi]